MVDHKVVFCAIDPDASFDGDCREGRGASAQLFYWHGENSKPALLVF